MKAMITAFSICALTFAGCGKKSGSNGTSSAGNGSPTSFIDTSTIESKVELTPTSQISLTSLTGFALSNGAVSAIRSASTPQSLTGMTGVKEIFQNNHAHFFSFQPDSEQNCVMGILTLSDGNYFCVPRVSGEVAAIQNKFLGSWNFSVIRSSPNGNFALFYTARASAVSSTDYELMADKSMILIDMSIAGKIVVSTMKPKTDMLDNEFGDGDHIPDDRGNILNMSPHIFDGRLAFRRASDRTIFLGESNLKNQMMDMTCFAFAKDGDLLAVSTEKNSLIRFTEAQLKGTSSDLPSIMTIPEDVKGCINMIATDKFVYLEKYIANVNNHLIQINLETKAVKSVELPKETKNTYTAVRYGIIQDLLIIAGLNSDFTFNILLAIDQNNLSVKRVDQQLPFFRSISLTDKLALMLIGEKILSYDPKSENLIWENFVDTNFADYKSFSAGYRAQFCTPGLTSLPIDCKSEFQNSMTASYTFTCNADGQTRTKSSCTLTACNAGYAISNGQCQPIVP